MAPETPFLHFVQIQVLKSALMTVVCDSMTVNVLSKRFKRTVLALGCGLWVRRDVQMVTLLYCLFTQRCSRSWLFCSNMTYKQAFLQFLARHSVFAAFEYPYKHHIDRPTCAVCSDLTAQTFLTLQLLDVISWCFASTFWVWKTDRPMEGFA